MRRWLAGLLAGVALLAGFSTGVAVDPPAIEPMPAVEVCEPGIVSGTIRWVDRTSWIVLDDAGHTPTGISHVELRADRVRVHYTFDSASVGSLQVTPDESFSSAGVRTGASVGLSFADVFFYMGTSATPVNPSLLSKSGANVWITGLFNMPCSETQGG